MAYPDRVDQEYLRRIEQLEQQLEQQLRASRNYMQILSDFPDSVLQFDRELRCIFVNKTAERASGMAAEMLLGKMACELDLPGGVNVSVSALRQALNTGKEQTEHYRRDGSDGVRHFQARYCPYGSDGYIAGVAIIAREVTGEWKRAPDTERLHVGPGRILDNISESFFVLDRNWRFTYLNSDGMESPNTPRHDLLGRCLWDVFPGLLQTAFETEFKKVMEQRVPCRFHAAFDSGGRWFEGHAYPLEDGICAYVVDITERKKAEQELHAAHQMLAALIHASPLPIVSLTPDGRITVWNAAAERVFGWRREEVTGKPLPFIPEEKLAEHRAMRARDLEGHGFTGHEVTRRRKDGSPIEISVSTAPIRDDDGHVIGIVSVYQDITERKKVEEQLARHAQELARSNADLQQFAFVTSHDLQEPLRTITSYAQLLARRYRGKMDRDADEFLDFITDGARRMQRLINDLLTFSRILHDRERALTEVSTENVLSWALMNLNTAIKETGAVITHDPLPKVVANEQEMIQLFQNLLSNAVKYHGPQPPVIHVSAEKREGEICFSVRDNGIGVAPAHHEHIFGIFKRLHGKNLPGTGIGLALCKRIVEKHGGRIWIESDAGRGATFFFTLPAS